MYGTNSRSMDYRDRRSYRRTDYNTKINRDYKVDVRNRPLPDLEMGNDSLKLRIVHSHTIIVVGVSEELSDVKVIFRPPLPPLAKTSTPFGSCPAFGSFLRDSCY